MTGDRELMQQALEALEAYRPVIVKRHGLTYSVGDSAITALRERLAQPEQTVTSDHSNSHQPEQSPLDRMAENARELRLDYEPVQHTKKYVTEQEPMAWQWLDTGTFRKSLPASAEPGAWRPLYTAQPPNTIANSEAIPKQISDGEAWRNAAIRVGEDLCSVGPNGYYDMTAAQWLDWALSVVTVHAPPRREWVGLDRKEMLAIIDQEKADLRTGLPMFWRDQVAIIARAIEVKLKEQNA